MDENYKKATRISSEKYGQDLASLRGEDTRTESRNWDFIGKDASLENQKEREKRAKELKASSAKREKQNASELQKLAGGVKTPSQKEATLAKELKELAGL